MHSRPSRQTLFSISSLVLFCLLMSFPQTSEICDNAIDDDQDGYIDLNDEDCSCATIEFSSLILNPSFEKMDCCPGAAASLNCATSWVQASAAYVHFFHECSFTNALIPQPIPDGGGVVGLANGRINEYSNYKEYLGACLTEPLQEGVPYKFQFEIGISPILDVLPMEVSLCGTPDCSTLPFGGTTGTIGCPTNTPTGSIGDKFIPMQLQGGRTWRLISPQLWIWPLLPSALPGLRSTGRTVLSPATTLLIT